MPTDFTLLYIVIDPCKLAYKIHIYIFILLVINPYIYILYLIIIIYIIILLYIYIYRIPSVTGFHQIVTFQTPR